MRRVPEVRRVRGRSPAARSSPGSAGVRVAAAGFAHAPSVSESPHGLPVRELYWKAGEPGLGLTSGAGAGPRGEWPEGQPETLPGVGWRVLSGTLAQ